MSTNTIWIVVAVIAAVLVIALLLLAVNKTRSRQRQRQAEEIREQAKLETAKVERREALAQETAAKARAAQAEAEAKAAEAARLQERAANHQSEVSASREQLEEQLKRADECTRKRPQSRRTSTTMPMWRVQRSRTIPRRRARASGTRRPAGRARARCPGWWR
ncbi:MULTISPECIES: hypothetical protein [unclassified Mycobacterium]|uniref:hypothetical protein n=1 Tax=unclassified Mycobacterium TaxID=2642494 RepID=UPI000AB0F2F2|nr:MULTISPECIES: hypothetical protein [unclassified Mycobacterium]